MSTLRLCDNYFLLEYTELQELPFVEWLFKKSISDIDKADVFISCQRITHCITPPLLHTLVILNHNNSGCV